MENMQQKQQIEEEQKRAEFQKQLQEREEESKRIKEEWEKRERESLLIAEEIKREYLPKDYCKNGDLDMESFLVLNAIIDKKCKERDIEYWNGNKQKLQHYFLCRRLEFLLRCMDNGLSYEHVRRKTKFDPAWLYKWYRRDKCEAKLKEEAELFKEE